MKKASEDPSRGEWAAASTWWLPIVLLWAAFFWQASFFWGSEGYYYLNWMVPPLALYFLWGRWKDAPRPGDPWPWSRGVAAVASVGAVFALFGGEAMPFWRPLLFLQAAATVLATLSILAACGGGAWLRHFSPVALFVLIALPFPDGFERDLIHHLTRWVAQLTELSLNLLGYPAEAIGQRIEVKGEVVEVGDACSGIRSFNGLFMIGLVVGELYRLGWNRVTLAIAAFCVSFPLNVMRALILSLLAVDSGWEAYDKWHDPLGGIVYFVGCACLLGLAILLPTRLRAARKRRGELTRLVAARAPGWGLVALLVLLIGGVQVWYASHSWPDGKGHAWVCDNPVETNGWQVRLRPPAPEVLELLVYDELTHFEVVKAGGEKVDLIEIYYRWGTRGLESTLRHSPDICMGQYAGGTVLENETGRGWQIGENRVHVNAFRIAYPDGREVFAYQGVWIPGTRGDGVSRYREFSNVRGFSSLDWILTATRIAAQGHRHFPLQVFLVVTEEGQSLDEAWDVCREVLDAFMTPSAGD
jgi:exosortase